MRNFDKQSLYFANSSKQPIILFHLICLLWITSFPSVISELRLYKCNNASTYAAGSTFSSNLNRVMGDLLKKAPQTGFNTSFYGQSPNRIYGLLQCTGNISNQNCSICSQRANASLVELCGNYVGGRVWQDMCFLRYENYSFYSKLDTDGDFLENAKDIVTSNLSYFKTTTSNLLSNLSDEAYDPANKGFAEGTVGYSSNGTIYGLVQCWRDISIKDCKSCLQAARKNLSECCSMKQGFQQLFGSCTLRYEIYPLLNMFNSTGRTSISPPAAPPGANPPTVASDNTSVNETSPTMSKSSSAKTVPRISGVVESVVISLIVCLFAMPSKAKSAIPQRPVIHAQNEVRHENDPESTLVKEEQILSTLEEAIEATDNFHENKKLGEGGFGPVSKLF